MKCYAVIVRETFERTAYINADSPEEAKRLARSPTNWNDCDDPQGAGNVVVLREPATVYSETPL